MQDSLPPCSDLHNTDKLFYVCGAIV